MKNKWKIIIPILVIAVLAGAFYFGGDAPGSRGWSVEETPATIVSPPPASAGTTDPAADTTPEVRNTPPQLPADDMSDSGKDNAKTQKPADTPEETPEPSETPEPTGTPEPTETSEPQSTATPTPKPTLEQTPVPTPQQTPASTPEPISDTTMEINPETGTDQYNTSQVPEGMPTPVEPQDVTIGTTAYTCTISISCATILNNMEYCDPAKAELVPADGWILQPVTVTFYEGESVFNVLQRVCKQQRIHMEYMDTPIYNSAYIEGIHNLYEFDVGEQSGWMYKVNEWFPNYGCSRYQLKNGDVIAWVYTCDLGRDVGGAAAAGSY